MGLLIVIMIVTSQMGEMVDNVGQTIVCPHQLLIGNVSDWEQP
jgi:hypothetical protein